MYSFRVEKNEPLTESTILLTLRKDPNEQKLFSFQPGQYAAISFKRRRRPTPARCFSIVSSPTDQAILQFSMRTRGHFTSAVKNLMPNDEVKVRGPFGGFVYDTARDNNAVFLAGGIGITPFISMARFASQTQLANRITLLYSCQNQDDIPFLDELRLLKKLNPNFNVTFVIAEGQVDKISDQDVKTGRITPEVIDRAANGNTSGISFFICGPPPFMKGLTSILLAKNVSGDNIFTEAFGQGRNRQTGKIQSWPLNIYAIGAASVVLGSFVVMAADLLKSLPPSVLLNPSDIARQDTLRNSRQTDLNKLVNSLPSNISSAAPETDAVKKAIQASTENTQPATQQPKAYTNTPKKSSPSASTPNQTTPTPAPSTAPAAPKCTTTQSGITTCI
jgi:ferredoxin-NADP reductase